MLAVERVPLKMPYVSRLLISALMLIQGIETCQVVHAAVGSDAVLPCEGESTITQLDVEWTRTGLPSGQYVYYQRNGREFDDNKHVSYKGRTSLFMENGIVSLKLSQVQESDGGTYECYVPEVDKTFTVQLIVDAAPDTHGGSKEERSSVGEFLGRDAVLMMITLCIIIIVGVLMGS